MNYIEYEAKVAKIAKKFAFIKRHRFPIIGIFTILFSFLFTMLGVSGIIQKDLSLNKEEYVYGEALSYQRSEAFISSPHYEYAVDETNPSWSDVVPTTVGDYLMRTYTYNGYRIKRYGKSTKFRIVPKEINLSILSSFVTYGDQPLTNAPNVLNRGDYINYMSLKYDNLTNLSADSSTNAEIDLSSLEILNESGVNVTSSYLVKTEKKRLRIDKRPLTLNSNSMSKVYDGVELKDSNVSITYGSLAEGDSFEVTPTATGSVSTIATTINRITPSKSNLKINNPKIGDVTHLYSINYNEGVLSLRARNLTIEGPVYEPVYSGVPQTPPLDSYNANSLNVNGLAEGDRITNVRFSINGGSMLVGEKSFQLEFDIRNSNGVSVKNNYQITSDPGKISIKKKDLIIKPRVNNSTQSSSDILYDSRSNKFTKEYDGSTVSAAIESVEGLCANDEITLLSAPSFSTPGTKDPISTGMRIRIRNNYSSAYDVTNSGYNIIYENRSFEITKKKITVNVSDLNLFESSSNISDRLISYSITSGGLLNGDRIYFTTLNPSFPKAGSYNLFSRFTLSILDNYNNNRYNYYDVDVNSPMIRVQKAKFSLNVDNQSLVYNGESQSYTASYSNSISVDYSKSLIPNNNTINRIEIRKSLTDVQKYSFTSSDVTSFSSTYSIQVDKNGNRTQPNLSMESSNVDFEFTNDSYFEITSRNINVTFNPPVKYFNNESFEPNLLLTHNKYITNLGSLANNHHFSFVKNREIINVGSYNNNELKNAYSLRIYDNNNRDVTSNYNLEYSFSNPLVIKRASVDLTIKDKSSYINSTYTVNDLLYKTYNDVETSTFDSSSNDYDELDDSYYDSIYTKSSNILNDYDYSFECKLGINPQKNVGLYNIIVHNFRLSISDIYGTNITSSDYVDINITNGTNAYEIKKRHIDYSIPNVTYIYDGENVDYNYELDLSEINNSLVSGHHLQITGNSISQVGTYNASNLGLMFTIYDSNNNDVTSNYELNWTNRSAFRLTVENVSVICKRSSSFNDLQRVYDGNPISEKLFYESVTSPNAIDDEKHFYEFEFEFKNGVIPDSYYDVGSIYLSSSNPASQYTDLYCYKHYNGKQVKILVNNITYNVTGNKTFVTNKRDLNIELNDQVFFIEENEYTFDYSVNSDIVSINGLSLAEGDRISYFRLKPNNGINGSNLSGNNSGTDSQIYYVNDYSQFFEIEIYNTKRNKVVTDNYNITYSGIIEYKKASLALQVTSQPSLFYSGVDYEIGQVIATTNSLPKNATYVVEYKYNVNGNTSISQSFKARDVGTYEYSINSVRVYLDNKDITSSVNLTYSTSLTAQTKINKSSLRISTDSYELGVIDNYEYRLSEPRITYVGFGSIKDFESRFTIIFSEMPEDPNGIYIVTGNNSIKVIRYGVTSNPMRGITIILKETGEEVTDNFTFSWIIGTITGVDISL